MELPTEMTPGEPLYFLVSFKRRFADGLVIFWGPNAAGYTPDIKGAGAYTADEAAKHEDAETVAGRLRTVPLERRVRALTTKGEIMGEWTMQEMMNLVEGYADLMKKAERGDATEAQCTEIWEAIRRMAESWEISARQCQAFWEEATTWRGAFVRKNGLAYCGQQKAIVRRDTEKPYLPPREFPPVWTSALDLEREKWAQICDGFDAVNPHIGQAAEVAKLLRSNA